MTAIQLHASALNRVIECNGSVAMGGAVEVPPEADQSETRREGTAAHFVAIEVLSGRFNDPIEWVDRQAPNGVYVTPDMAENLETFIEAVRADQAEGCQVWLEHEVDFDISSHTRVLARPDVISYNPATQTLKVRDFKYGFRLVEPERNWTLVAYLIGWVMHHHITPERVEMTIHQPRPYHEDGKIRTLSISYDALLSLYEEMATKLAALTTTLKTGSWCYKCPARAKCPALREAAFNVIEAVNEAFSDEVTDDELRYEFELMQRAAELAKQRVDALEELISHRITLGRVFPDYFLEMGKGNYRYNKGVDANLVKSITGIDISKPGMLSRSEALRKGVPEVVLNALMYRPDTAIQLKHKKADKVASKMFKPQT